ncbi:uncharacterized protein B0T23DRAFT_402180 [Neurospora hispaniola]|uniref:NTF2-like domain-containing protein n=1 Tax=Neurospora hispaniola TaxID=588809 RepID=A0AAJ0MTG4_9PEZI|nr:hypothetical protein B0T23DRAFT_402180 [Neurospora hispaniola]
MHFPVLANAAFASSALPVPSLASAIALRQESACLIRAEAKDIVDIYGQLIANYTDDVCANINTFIFTPLGEPTVATKEIFMSVRNANPPFPVVGRSIDAIDYETVALRWHATFGAANLPSKGITIIGTTKREGYAQTKSLDVEFNSLIWLLNMGGNYTWEG